MFSILIPVYNVEAYLRECLASVDAQTYKDYEVVLVDDGSTDGSGAICDEYVAQRPYSGVIHQDNKGLYLARLAARKHALGKYYIFVDSDDCIHPQLLSRLYEVIERDEPDLVLYHLSKKADYSVQSNRTGLSPGVYEGGDIDRIRRCCALEMMNGLHTKCFRRELFDETEDESGMERLTYAEDWLLTAMTLGSARRISVISDVLYYVRTRPTSSMHTFRAGTVSQYARAWRMLQGIAAGWGGDFPSLMLRGIAGDAFGVTERMFNFHIEQEVFGSESVALRGTIADLGLVEAEVTDLVECYHRIAMGLFMKGRYGVLRAILAAHAWLRRRGAVFYKLKGALKRR